MGASHSREGDLESSDSDSETESQNSPVVQATPQQQQFQDASAAIDVEKKLSALSIDGNGKSLFPDLKSSAGARVKLYRHIGGNSPTAKWAVADKLVLCRFVREGSEAEDDEHYESDAEDDDDDYEEGLSKNKGFRTWLLQVGDKVCARVDERLQLRAFDEQLRVDFVNRGVWAIKFLNPNDFKAFLQQLQNCIFENTYLMEASQANKIKVFGKDFLGWADPNAADESIWEAAEENPDSATPKTEDDDAVMEYEEDIAESGGIQSLAMGALDYSFLVSGRGVEAVKNMQNGIQGKGISVPFRNSGLMGVTSTPKKAMLIRAETNMLLMSPAKEGRPHSTGLHQLDIETGKIVTEWKFEKDGTPITMRDVTNDNKGSQLDPSASTFLGLDDNRLCRWDMRLKHGVAQQIAGDEEDGPVLTWQQGHQFSKGTNFQCFASTGDGSVVVGSADGKIRLYGKTSMRMAKTAFPGLGSPVTHVDVTYDGKWILGTTDTYLILISTLFTDKGGKLKTGFAGRMGNKIAAPRLLKLTPVDSHLAGPTHNFQGGKFSWVTESGKQEHHLVATVGNFTVIWNFKQVKNSNHECYRNQDGLKSCYCYKIVPKDESIVDSSFMHDKFAITDNPEAPLVVVTPKNVSSFSIACGR